MKKAVLPLLLLCLSQGINAQEGKATDGYNKWSIEASAGMNKPGRTFSEGYRTSRLEFITGDLGVRYMFNNKFGLKFDVGYNRFENADNTPEFETTFWRADLQGVINLGRILSFEDWTSRLGLLLHGGAGVFRLEAGDNSPYQEADHGLNLIGGITGQIRLSDRIALTGDFSASVNGVQNLNFDGMSAVSTNVVDGVLMTGTVGLTFYLGKNEKHADWYTYNITDQLNELDKRVGDLETMMNDSDKDGVPDYLDAEPNSIAGVSVDSKGRANDRNNNGIPDELESYIENRTANNNSSNITSDLADLINGGYVNVYFDFNQDQPNAQSVSGVNFLIRFLKENKDKSADVIGYADEVGATEYNKALSTRRAENVKKILVDAGIEASRLNIVGNGEDSSVSKSSKYARQTVRRVTFIIK